ncbi:MAG: hypothetical protein Q4D21_00655 [Phascolarctobacterium sp.]|nr:hypothetical protein [Phascolarctobacterium sp.]
MSKDFLKISLCVVLALLVSGCANDSNKQGKIAVVNWEKAVSAHPLDAKLKTGEKILKELVQRRKYQENIARTQMSSLSKLQTLKKISEQNYHLADINTRMLQMRTYENDLLQRKIKIYESEADEMLAERKNQIEKDYQLEIFNLELKMGNVTLKPEVKAEYEKKVAETKALRDTRLAQLTQEKKVIVAQKTAPYLEQVKARLAEQEVKLQQKASAEMNSNLDRDAQLMADAPSSLKQAFEIMDKEIDKQQNKNAKLRKEISTDIEQAAVDLAKKRGYSIVFNQFKANVNADDITNDIIGDLKKIKKDNK